MAGVVAGAAVLPVTLSAIGLGMAGPAAGSLFAYAQAAGWVGVGSVFATAQSIAMGGSVATATTIKVATIAVGTAAGSLISERSPVEVVSNQQMVD